MLILLLSVTIVQHYCVAAADGESVHEMSKYQAYKSVMLNLSKLSSIKNQNTISRQWPYGVGADGKLLEVEGFEQEFKVEDSAVKIRIKYGKFESEDVAHEALGFHVRNIAARFETGSWAKVDTIKKADEILFSKSGPSTAIILRHARTCVLIKCNGGDIAERKEAAALFANKIIDRLRANSTGMHGRLASDLPYRIQVSEIVRKLKTAKGVGGFLIIKDREWQLRANGRVLRPVTFKLCSEKMNVYRVTVYDYRSWNRVCDKVYRRVSNSTEGDNVSQDYAMEKDDNTYTVLYKGEKHEKWHFDLGKMLIIHVDPEFSENEADENEQYKIRRINEVIEEVMAFIEGKAASSAEQKAKYQEIKKRYQKTAE